MNNVDDFSINKNISINIQNVGLEKEKILIIDNFLNNPKLLVNMAAHQPFIPYHTQYPGVKSLAPAEYTRQLFGTVVPIIKKHYQLPQQCTIEHTKCLFSLITHKEDDLNLFQRAPHRDSSYEYQFAILLYLCGPEHGGTSFYRHNLTHFETITRARSATYDQTYDDDVKQHGEPEPRYQLDSDRRYSKTGEINACFNRLVIYRSCLLHSPYINLQKSIDTNPHTGRLTLNSFLAFM
jgi:hypothetical protein